MYLCTSVFGGGLIYLLFMRLLHLVIVFHQLHTFAWYVCQYIPDYIHRSETYVHVHTYIYGTCVCFDCMVPELAGNQFPRMHIASKTATVAVVKRSCSFISLSICARTIDLFIAKYTRIHALVAKRFRAAAIISPSC